MPELPSCPSQTHLSIRSIASIDTVDYTISAAEFPSPPPSAYIPSHSHPARRSVISIKRKPVPARPAQDAADDLDLAMNDSGDGLSLHLGDDVSLINMATTPTPTTPPSGTTILVPSRSSSLAPSSSLNASRSSVQPPRYVLAVALPPLTHGPSPPEYVRAATTGHTHLVNTARSDTLAFGIQSDLVSVEDLPTYAEDTETEPKTLARALWRWGRICPLLWLIGMLILWTPLRPIEEEMDPEKAQKLEEMIVIIRETELKYARRCLYGFSAFVVVVVVLIVVAVAVAVSVAM